MLLAGLDLGKNHLGMVVKSFERDQVYYAVGAARDKINIPAHLRCFYFYLPMMSYSTFKKEFWNCNLSYSVASALSIVDFIKEKISLLRQRFSLHLHKTNLPIVFSVEGLAFAGTKIADTAFVFGIVCSELMKMDNVFLRIHDPQSLKLWACGKGNADKDAVLQAVRDKYDANIPDELPKTAAYDLADAYVLLKMLECEMNVRKNPSLLDELPTYQKRIFLRTTYSMPENLLARPFACSVLNGQPDFV